MHIDFVYSFLLQSNLFKCIDVSSSFFVFSAKDAFLVRTERTKSRLENKNIVELDRNYTDSSDLYSAHQLFCSDVFCIFEIVTLTLF